MSGKDLPTIGIMIAGTERPIEGFKTGLKEFGLVEGQTVRFEQRVANGELGKLPAFAVELARLNVDVIALIGAVTARAAQKVTTTIPIIYSVVVDPVSDGLATSVERPGGNMTGVTSFDPNQARTHVDLLRSVSPKLSRVAVLSDKGVSECMSGSNDQAIREAGLSSQIVRVLGPEPDLEGAFAAMRRDQADALIAVEEPIIGPNRMRIAQTAMALRLPTIFPREMSDAGGLFSYGTSLRTATRHMAQYVKNVLDGAKPGEMPIQTLSAHELVVNLQTAARLGLTVPTHVLDRAVEVIQ
jgi:putative tryptophan/tyrosine transport system substrate-binding protein